MTWFKVDDKLHDHRKAYTAGTEAMGLWVLAGSWSADNLTDGFIPQRIIGRWTRKGASLSSKLVAAGLWLEATVDGEAGWQFHQWNENGRQPTRAQVEADREAARERQRRGREAQASRRDKAALSQRDNGVTHGVTSASVTVVPSRPVPSLVQEQETPRAPRSTPDLDTDPDFVAFWSAYPRREGKGDAKRAWPRALKRTSGADLIVAAKAYAERTRDTERQFVKTPAAWLNAERWADDTAEPVDHRPEWAR